MKSFIIRSWSPFIWLVLAGLVASILVFINPAIVPWLVVSLFVVLTLKFTSDGVILYNNLVQQVPHFFQELRTHLYTQCQSIKQENREKINRLALIEKTCSEHQNLQLWEKKKHYYQILPNLLLAIGLLGTFVGITINLILLSRNTAGEIQLQKTLADIIGSMAIAFVSSLIAIFCSVLLTKFYPSYDLEIQKNNLFSYLENYLDNEYFISQNQPTIQDKIDELKISIDTYASRLDIFVGSFPKYIKDFEQAVTQASQKLITSAHEFENVTSQSSQTMQTSANVLINATSSLRRLTTTFSDITRTLDISAKSMDSTTQMLEKYIPELQRIGNALVNNSLQVQSLIQNNQQDLGNISHQLVQNTNNLTLAVQSYNTNISQVTAALSQHTKQVENHNAKLHKFSEVIQSTTESLHPEFSQVVAALHQQKTQVEANNRNLQKVAVVMENYIQMLGKV